MRTISACAQARQETLTRLEGTTRGPWLSNWEQHGGDQNQIRNAEGEIVVGTVEHDGWPYFCVTEENARLIVHAPQVHEDYARLLGEHAQLLRHVQQLGADLLQAAARVEQEEYELEAARTRTGRAGSDFELMVARNALVRIARQSGRTLQTLSQEPTE